MKNLIFGATIVILILISFSVLATYYLQDFNEDLTFVKSISYDGMDIRKTTIDEVNYLQSANGKFGELTLENKGYFTQIYKFPYLLGCLKLKENISDDDAGLINSGYITISFFKNNSHWKNTNTLKVSMGSKEKYDVMGIYKTRGSNVPIYKFQDSIEKISIYKIPEDTKNPLSNGEGYASGNYLGDDCNQIRNDLEPIAEFSLSA